MQVTSGGMNGKVVLITGGTSGIGKATAKALAAMGAEVVVTGRNEERGRSALEEIRQESGGDVSLLLADLSTQAGTRKTAEDFLSGHDRLDVLVNNAGVIQQKRTETADGIETTLAVNHLGPFLLTNLLLDTLKESAPSRIITTSSDAERFGKMDFDDLQARESRYRAFRQYGLTKLANIMFTFELAEKLRGTGVSANCFHPGAVNTSFGAGNGGLFSMMFNAFKPFMRSPEGGADTLIYLASSPEVEGMSGKYVSDRKVRVPSSPIVYDEGARRKLWEISEELTGLKVTA